MARDSCGTWSKDMWSWSLPSFSSWKIGARQSPLLITFQKEGSQVLEKDFLGCKTKRLLKRFTFQKGREKKFTSLPK